MGETHELGLTRASIAFEKFLGVGFLVVAREQLFGRERRAQGALLVQAHEHHVPFCVVYLPPVRLQVRGVVEGC